MLVSVMGYVDTRAIGRYAEDMAVVFLVRKQWRILGRNLHYRFGEIDILAADLVAKQLVIVEVKAKRDATYGRAIEMLTPSKKRTLVKLAKWVQTAYNKPVRVDVVAIDNLMSPTPHVQHYPFALGE
jgi:putative endonuclease